MTEKAQRSFSEGPISMNTHYSGEDIILITSGKIVPDNTNFFPDVTDSYNNLLGLGVPASVWPEVRHFVPTCFSSLTWKINLSRPIGWASAII